MWGETTYPFLIFNGIYNQSFCWFRQGQIIEYANDFHVHSVTSAIALWNFYSHHLIFSFDAYKRIFVFKPTGELQKCALTDRNLIDLLSLNIISGNKVLNLFMRLSRMWSDWATHANKVCVWCRPDKISTWWVLQLTTIIWTVICFKWFCGNTIAYKFTFEICTQTIYRSREITTPNWM